MEGKDAMSPLKFIAILVLCGFLSVFIIAMPLYSGILILLGLFFAFAVRIKEGFFYFILLLVPIDRFYFPIFFRLKYYQVFLIPAVVFSMVVFFVNNQKNRFKLNLLDWSILFIFIARITSLLYTIDILFTFKALILYGLFIVLYFYIRSKAISLDPKKNLNFMIYTSSVFIGFGFLELLGGNLGVGLLQISSGNYVYAGRPWSVFREPDWFGGYLTFIISLGIPFIKPFLGSNLTGASRSVKTGARAGFSDEIAERAKPEAVNDPPVKAGDSIRFIIYKYVIYLALLMSLLIVVRSSWLGLLVGVIVIFILNRKSRKILTYSIFKSLGITLLCLLFALFFSFSHYRSIVDRFGSIFSALHEHKIDAAAQVRLNSYDVIASYIARKPIQGYGAGAWEFLSQQHQYVNVSLSTNNLLLTPIFEMGVLGLILYLIFFYALFKLFFDALKYASTDLEVRYSCGIAIAVISTLIVSIFNDIMLTGFYWAFIALFNNYVCELKNKYAVSNK
jgi:hypothetical protein